MSKMMIVAATSEKMLELMDKITIEEGVISFLASNKATAKGYPCMFSVEGKTTTASVKFEAKIKGLDEKGEVVPVEKLSVYLPARFAGSVRAVAEQTDIVYMQFEEKQVTLLSQKPAIQIPVSFVEEPTKVKNPKTDAFSMSIPLEKISQYLPHGLCGVHGHHRPALRGIPEKDQSSDPVTGYGTVRGTGQKQAQNFGWKDCGCRAVGQTDRL